ncbi:hypothetical protein [Nocardioides sp.]|uniref:hypothetical protein n=1 Tax=Nocardioides sp. TaxID=35761 RepID=UPI0035643453
MNQSNRIGRRRLFAGALAGGVIGAAPAASSASSLAAAKTGNVNGIARMVAAKKLRVGDLIVGPHSTLVRLALVTRLSSGAVRLRYTDPVTGKPTPFDATSDRQGFPARQRFVVLRRRVGVGSVRLGTSVARDDMIIDGGKP